MQLLKINSPATVVEGESYSVRLTVTNRSTKAGIPVGAPLEIVISAATAWTTLIPVTPSTEAFAAGETRSFDYAMGVPLGSGGEFGQIIGLVRDPTGIEVARAAEDLNIVEVAPPPEEHSLSVDVSPNVGYVTVVPSKFTYEHGEVVTLTAYLYSGYEGYYYLDH